MGYKEEGKSRMKLVGSEGVGQRIVRCVFARWTGFTYEGFGEGGYLSSNDGFLGFLLDLHDPTQ